VPRALLFLIPPPGVFSFSQSIVNGENMAEAPFFEPHEIEFVHVPNAALKELLRVRNGQAGPFQNGSEPSAPSSLTPIIDALKNNENPAPLESVLRIATSRYGCDAIIEYPYFDLEEWDSYSAFYSRAFVPYERLCRRIHFLAPSEGAESHFEHAIGDFLSRLRTGGKDIPPAEPDSDLPRLNETLAQSGIEYKGFLVLRPLRSFVVGRTLIAFDARDVRELPQGYPLHYLEGDGRPFCTTQIANRFHFGHYLCQIDTPPSIQQNPIIGRCLPRPCG